MSNKLRLLICAVLLIVTRSVNAGAAGVGGDQTRAASQRSAAKADLAQAAGQYKASVQALIPIYEENLRTAAEALAKRKDLFEKGLASKRDVDASEQALGAAKTQLDESRQQLTESDQLMAEANAESIKPPAAAKSGRYSTNARVMTYNGAGGWAIAQASLVEGFFAAKFGRQLPISAFGQSGTHNRLGFDHRNSVDVALHPDSAEGKALIEYLRTSGIPFLAFRAAIPGVATGAHIHIGYPSHRVT